MVFSSTILCWCTTITIISERRNGTQHTLQPLAYTRFLSSSFAVSISSTMVSISWNWLIFYPCHFNILDVNISSFFSYLYYVKPSQPTQSITCTQSSPVRASTLSNIFPPYILHPDVDLQQLKSNINGIDLTILSWVWGAVKSTSIELLPNPVNKKKKTKITRNHIYIKYIQLLLQDGQSWIVFDDGQNDKTWTGFIH